MFDDKTSTTASSIQLLEQHVRGLAYFKNVLGLKKHETALTMLQADAWLNHGRPQLALELYEKVLQQHPDCDEARSNARISKEAYAHQHSYPLHHNHPHVRRPSQVSTPMDRLVWTSGDGKHKLYYCPTPDDLVDRGFWRCLEFYPTGHDLFNETQHGEIEGIVCPTPESIPFQNELSFSYYPILMDLVIERQWSVMGGKEKRFFDAMTVHTRSESKDRYADAVEFY